MHELTREKALFRYTQALERGDFDTVAVILKAAETDLQLERMLREIDEVFVAEAQHTAQLSPAAVIQQLVQEHFSAASDVDTSDELPPLTVKDVAWSLSSNNELQAPIRHEAKTIVDKVTGKNLPLPAQLNRKAIEQLFKALGISVSRRFTRLFQDAAIYLTMGREQDVRRLAAARRQQLAEPKADYGVEEEE